MVLEKSGSSFSPHSGGVRHDLLRLPQESLNGGILESWLVFSHIPSTTKFFQVYHQSLPQRHLYFPTPTLVQIPFIFF